MNVNPPVKPLTVLNRLCAEHPGLGHYIDRLRQFSSQPAQVFRERFERGIQWVGEEEIQSETWIDQPFHDQWAVMLSQ